MSQDVLVLARTIYGEARNQGEQGMEAIANVILNRVAQPGWWGRSIETVCLHPFQFSCWLPKDPNYRVITAVSDKDVAFRMALEIAQEAKAGLLRDETGGATSYYERHLAPPPSWTCKMKFTCRIGDHLFYR